MPATIHEAVALAVVYEYVGEQPRRHTSKYQAQVKAPLAKPDTYPNPKVQTGDLWKARQLKDYRRANGLCFKCGEKFTPQHQCTPVQAQLKAMEMGNGNVILADELLDSLDQEDQHSDTELMHVSLQELAGTEHSNTLRLRALTQNQVLIILIDSGSSHSFLDQSMVHRLSCTTSPIPAQRVKMANGEFLQCQEEVQHFSWWVQGQTFTHDMKILQLGGYDMILGMDWLEKCGEMKCH